MKYDGTAARGYGCEALMETGLEHGGLCRLHRSREKCVLIVRALHVMQLRTSMTTVATDFAKI